MRRLIGSAVLVLLFAASVWAREPVMVPVRVPTPQPARELLVKYKAGSVRAAALAGGRGLEALGVARLPLASGQTIQAAAARLRQDPDVEWAQPNEWRYALAEEVIPNDPYYLPQRNSRHYQQWHLPRISANYAWSVGKGSDAVVAAVVDSGVDLNHPDLRSRLLPGISIVNQDNYSAPAGGMDDNGHGTHVAGLIAAATDNNVGVAGCSWAGKILPVKVLNKDGAGTDADIVAGIMWAADHGAKIINLSLGGPSPDGSLPQGLQDAVNYAYGRGCLLIAAAGNSGDNQLIYPAALANVVAVAATDPWDQRASYSTYGSFVAFAAPGGSGLEALTQETGILSTFWDDNSAATDQLNGAEAGEYAITVGTSMAAAVASGAALVVWAQNPGWGPGQVADQLKNNADPLGTGVANQQTGTGRLNLLRALGNPPVSHPELALYCYPNPFSPERDGGTHIVFWLDRPADVQLSIFDVSRDLVWRQEYTAGETTADKNVKFWNGRNGLGEAVANGAYYMRVTAGGGRVGNTKLIAVLR